MSLFDYRLSQEISKDDPSFAALIMAAMRKADDRNLTHLRSSWPEIWNELQARYHAPGGILPSERAQHQGERTGPDRRQRHLIRSDERREEGRDRRKT